MWHLDLKNGSGSAGAGEPSTPADATLSMSSSDFVKMFQGQLKATMAFMGGKLKIKGDMGKAMKLEKLMAEFQKLEKSAPSGGQAAPAAAASSGSSGGQVEGMFTKIRELLGEDIVQKIGAVYQFDISGMWFSISGPFSLSQIWYSVVEGHFFPRLRIRRMNTLMRSCDMFDKLILAVPCKGAYYRLWLPVVMFQRPLNSIQSLISHSCWYKGKCRISCWKATFPV